MYNIYNRWNVKINIQKIEYMCIKPPEEKEPDLHLKVLKETDTYKY